MEEKCRRFAKLLGRLVLRLWSLIKHIKPVLRLQNLARKQAEEVPVQWNAPPEDEWCKINCDGAFQASKSTAGVGWLRDSVGTIMTGVGSG